MTKSTGTKKIGFSQIKQIPGRADRNFLSQFNYSSPQTTSSLERTSSSNKSRRRLLLEAKSQRGRSAARTYDEQWQVTSKHTSQPLKFTYKSFLSPRGCSFFRRTSLNVTTKKTTLSNLLKK